jgi:hypothetical protein
MGFLRAFFPQTRLPRKDKKLGEVVAPLTNRDYQGRRDRDASPLLRASGHPSSDDEGPGS